MSGPESLRVEVEGLSLGANLWRPAAPGSTLLVALHGGTYTSRYFDVRVGGASLPERAVADGIPVLTFDRPGYGESTALPTAENTFARQATILAQAIEEMLPRSGASSAFLVGHSIGGMIGVELAASAPDLRLIGASFTGMGAVIRQDGPAQALAGAAAASGEEVIDLPYEARDQVMLGPEWTFTPELREEAHSAYALAPVCELVEAPRWGADRLPSLAARVTLPVHHALAEFDALWDSSPDAVAQFPAALGNAPWVESGIARGTGHSIDHHLLGSSLHERQIAFLRECELLAAQAA